jgi:hypothetical protein
VLSSVRARMRAPFEGAGVEVVRGDMLDAASLDPAFADIDAVVTSAAGYTRRRKSDTPPSFENGPPSTADAAQSRTSRTASTRNRGLRGEVPRLACLGFPQP